MQRSRAGLIVVLTGRVRCGENLQRLDAGGLLPLGALLDLEADLLALLKRFEATSLNLGEVRKQVFAAVIRRDESEPLRIVKPFDGTRCHTLNAPRKSVVNDATGLRQTAATLYHEGAVTDNPDFL